MINTAYSVETAHMIASDKYSRLAGKCSQNRHFSFLTFETDSLAMQLFASLHCDLVVDTISAKRILSPTERNGIVCNRNLTALVERISMETALLNKPILQYVEREHKHDYKRSFLQNCAQIHPSCRKFCWL